MWFGQVYDKDSHNVTFIYLELYPFNVIVWLHLNLKAIKKLFSLFVYFYWEFRLEMHILSFIPYDLVK